MCPFSIKLDVHKFLPIQCLEHVPANLTVSLPIIKRRKWAIIPSGKFRFLPQRHRVKDFFYSVPQWQMFIWWITSKCGSYLRTIPEESQNTEGVRMVENNNHPSSHKGGCRKSQISPPGRYPREGGDLSRSRLPLSQE